MKLYDINREHLQLLEKVEELEGELTDELEQALLINHSELKAKSLSYVQFLKHKEAENAAIDQEIKRLQSLKKRNSDLINFLNHGLLWAVRTFGKITTGTFTISIQKSESVEVTSQQMLPMNFLKKEVKWTVDKVAVKKAIKEGEQVPGAYLKQNDNLQIK